MSTPDRPRVVVLCGSSRFFDEYQLANYQETMAGRIVLSIGFYPHSSTHGEGVGHDSEQKKALDELHLRKIDLADEVLLIAPMAQKCECGAVWKRDFKPGMRLCVEVCGCHRSLKDIPFVPYIGASTAREVAYAESLGKPVRVWEGGR